jgi:hypothetical protein
VREQPLVVAVLFSPELVLVSCSLREAQAVALRRSVAVAAVFHQNPGNLGLQRCPHPSF